MRYYIFVGNKEEIRMSQIISVDKSVQMSPRWKEIEKEEWEKLINIISE